MSATTRLTIDDFEKLPQELAENHELVDGELVEVSGNNLRNNTLRDELMEVMRPFVRQAGLGKVVAEQEFDFDGNAHAPDVSFYGREKMALADPGLRVQRFVPDLAIEIVSPNDKHQSLARKRLRYRRCGTKEVWIFSPETRDVHVYSDRGDRILNEDAELETPLLPGLRLSIRRFFDTA